MCRCGDGAKSSVGGTRCSSASLCELVSSQCGCSGMCFFFQAEDGIRDLVRSRGLGDVYKRQAIARAVIEHLGPQRVIARPQVGQQVQRVGLQKALSLIHI